MNGQEMVVDIMVRSDPEMNRKWVHEPGATERLQQSVYKTGTVAAKAGKVAGTDAGATNNILQSVISVNPETLLKVIHENDELLAPKKG